MSPGLSKEEVKQALKEASKEWLDEKYAQFGRWTLMSILCGALAALLMFLASHGGLDIKPHP